MLEAAKEHSGSEALGEDRALLLAGEAGSTPVLLTPLAPGLPSSVTRLDSLFPQDSAVWRHIGNRAEHSENRTCGL